MVEISKKKNKKNKNVKILQENLINFKLKKIKFNFILLHDSIHPSLKKTKII